MGQNYRETKGEADVVACDRNVDHSEMHLKGDLRYEEVVISTNLGEKHLVMDYLAYEKPISMH